MKIYTRTGDSGETSFFGGQRVSKADARVAAYGDVDELNAWLGFVRANLTDAHIGGMLEHLQRDLFAVGARLADPAHKIAERVAKAAVTPADIAAATTAPLSHRNGRGVGGEGQPWQPRRSINPIPPPLSQCAGKG